MSYEFFDRLTSDEVDDFFSAYLADQRARAPETVMLAKQYNVRADFSIDSVASVLERLFDHYVAASHGPDKRRNPDELDNQGTPPREAAHRAVLSGSFYLGESFVKSYDRLEWRLGEAGISTQNKPVVAGFRHGIEMAPIIVVDNLYERILRDGTRQHISAAVKKWAELV